MRTASLSAVVAYFRQLSERDARRCSERQLLASFTSVHDEAAFAEIVRLHGPMVLATCRRVLRHTQDAEDAFQATFLVLARKLATIYHALGVDPSRTNRHSSGVMIPLVEKGNLPVKEALR
jgi:hypothetical protein